MTSLGKLLVGFIGIELLAAGVLCGWRLNATLPIPPPVELYSDAITGRELLALPDRFLFDSVLKWRALGEAYMICGFFSKAEACLNQAARCDPRATEILVTRGYCLQRLGMLDEAREEFHRAAKQGRRDVVESAYCHLGLILLQLERPEEAREAFENAGEEHLFSVYERAKLLVRSGLAREAGPLLKRLADAHPDDLRVWQLRARAAESLGETEAAAEARDAAERARVTLSLDERPSLDVIDAAFGLVGEIARARQQQRAGNKALGADKMLELAREENHCENKNPAFLQDAVPVQLEAGGVAVARILLERQIQRDGYPTAKAWELLGSVDFMENHPQQAWQKWGRAEQMRPESIDHDKLVEAAQRTGDPLAARRHRALGRQYAGMEAYRKNDLASAARNLRQATAIDPNLADAWFYIGQTERLRGNRTAGEAAFRRCLKLNPEHGRARVQLDRLAR